MRPTAAALALLLVVLLATACGGGGDSSTPIESAPSFEGDWHFVLLTAGGGGFRAAWGTATSDAAGAVATSTSSNTDGGISTDVPASATASVAPDGTFTFTSVGGTLHGGISRAGDVAVCASLPSTTPVIAVFLRKAGSFSTASLNGAFHAVRMRRKLGVSSASGQRSGGITYDGVGGTSDALPAAGNDDGAIVGGGFGTGTYSVDAEGHLTVGNMRGGVLAGAAALIAGGRTSGDPMITVSLPVSTAATNARFAGSYAVVGMQSHPTSGAWQSTVAELLANGSGGGTMSGTANGETGSLTIGPAATPWAIDGAGALDLTLYDGSTLKGGISPDGRLAILGGATQTGMAPAIFVLVRRD